MPFPGLFLSSTSILNTGPTQDPEFHLKARSTRIGKNIEWPDASSKLVLTGRIEGDYEGNFSEVDNRDVSSIRSSMFSLRMAVARLDYAPSSKTDVYFEGGQVGLCLGPPHCQIFSRPQPWATGTAISTNVRRSSSSAGCKPWVVRAVSSLHPPSRL